MGAFEGFAFLVQAICLDASGAPSPVPSLAPECTARRLQRVDDDVLLRRHDNADVEDRNHPRGYQASDSVLAEVAGRALAVQTFDFGGGERRFSRFDAARGDGGQIVTRIGQDYYAIFTEDGGAGQQWFVGPECDEATGVGRLRGWLMFGGDVARGRWTQTIARLNIAGEVADCAASYSPSLTRYRLDRERVEMIRIGEDGRGEPLVFSTEMIVSEHYGRGDIASSDHLERFFFAKGLGLVRWERWENLAESLLPDAAERARHLAATGRCGPRPHSRAPGQGWATIDCREWLNLHEVPPQERSEPAYAGAWIAGIADLETAIGDR